jgi:hypothetical protein
VGFGAALAGLAFLVFFAAFFLGVFGLQDGQGQKHRFIFDGNEALAQGSRKRRFLHGQSKF